MKWWVSEWKWFCFVNKYVLEHIAGSLCKVYARARVCVCVWASLALNFYVAFTWVLRMLYCIIKMNDVEKGIRQRKTGEELRSRYQNSGKSRAKKKHIECDRKKSINTCSERMSIYFPFIHGIHFRYCVSFWVLIAVCVVAAAAAAVGGDGCCHMVGPRCDGIWTSKMLRWCVESFASQKG